MIPTLILSPQVVYVSVLYFYMKVEVVVKVTTKK